VPIQRLIISKIDNWEDFLSSAKKWTKEGPNGPNIYRGQADEKWNLIPSLSRLLIQKGHNPRSATFSENKVLERFKKLYRENDDLIKKLNRNDLLAWWEIMQQYSWPTRLLDWTKSPFVALYFAVSSLPDENGTLYVMDAGHLQWIQSIRTRDPLEKPNLAAFKELNKSVNGKTYEKSMVVISSPNPTYRMLAQQSSFTISTEILEDHNITGDDITFSKIINREERKPSIFYKFVISSELKSHFIMQLYNIGIFREALFPDSRIMDTDNDVSLNIVEEILDKHSTT